MKRRKMWKRISSVVAIAWLLLSPAAGQDKRNGPVTVPMILDHNRILVDAGIQRKDGSWRKARLWVDTGNPEFMLTEELAKDLGFDLSSQKKNADGIALPIEVPPPAGLRIGGMTLDVTGVKTYARSYLKRSLVAMPHDVNLPSTVLKRYHLVFDYPNKRLTLGGSGSVQPIGKRIPLKMHPETGIVQIDAAIAGEKLSLALDVGATFSFISEEVLSRLLEQHSDWKHMSGAIGCANIRGWWPQEDSWQILRVPEIRLESLALSNIGIAGLPNMYSENRSLGEWYSEKTARPVVGFLGPNALKACRIEIDYANGAAYFEKTGNEDAQDMDLVGLTLCPDGDGNYSVVGVPRLEGKSGVEGVLPGDKLVQVDGLIVRGVTMGTVVDSLRGHPGDTRMLIIERGGKRFRIKAIVKRFL